MCLAPFAGVAPAGTGLRWPDSFSFVGRVPVPNVPAGQSRIAGPLLWDPPNPYPSNHFCFYVRAANPRDPVSIVEGPSVALNTAQSNNLAWRNVNVVDVQGWDYVTFLTRNFDDEEDAEVDIEISVPARFEPAVDMEIRMSPALFDMWREGGSRGRGFDATALGETTMPEPGERPDPAFDVPSIWMTAPTVRFARINYAPNQAEPMALTFSARTEEPAEFPVDVVQWQTDRATGERTAVGGIRYLVRTGARGDR